MLTIAPPAVIGRIEAAAAMHMTTSASVGEKPTPSALSRNVLPRARIDQQPKRKPLATNIGREKPALSPTLVKIRPTRSERETNGSRTRRGPRASTPMQPRQKSSTTISGARKIAPEVTSAATASGSIATASTRPSEMIERPIVSSPSRTPPSRRSVAILTT